MKFGSSALAHSYPLACPLMHAATGTFTSRVTKVMTSQNAVTGIKLSLLFYKKALETHSETRVLRWEEESFSRFQSLAFEKA